MCDRFRVIEVTFAGTHSVTTLWQFQPINRRKDNLWPRPGSGSRAEAQTRRQHGSRLSQCPSLPPVSGRLGPGPGVPARSIPSARAWGSSPGPGPVSMVIMASGYYPARDSDDHDPRPTAAV